MKRNLLLIRHGQATFNVEHRLPGQLPGIPLTEEGRRQAQRTGEALAGLPISAIITSPLERARETAALVAHQRDIPIHIDAALADTNIGKWAGLNYNELSKNDKEWQTYIRQSSAAPEGVETSLEVQARAVRAAERARRAPDLGEYVAMVAHADVIKFIIAYYTGVPAEWSRFLSIDNASVTVLAFGEHEHPPAILALNWTPSPDWLTYKPAPPVEEKAKTDGQATANPEVAHSGRNTFPILDCVCSSEMRSQFVFDPRNPYERRMWHYESDRPLSVAQLITLGSMDTRVGALLWLLIERHTSYIISGPTDPTPGVGKTTTLNAMLDFLPNGSALVYTSGMFERFEFKELEEIEPAKTLVLCNEVSDHLRIYMWGRVARRFLDLPAEGYAIATSMHADTLDDVLDALMGDLRLTAGQTSRLGLIVNIGLVGRVWPPKRRFLTVNLLLPESPEDNGPQTDGSKVTPLRQEREQVQILQLSRWVQQGDYFTTPDDATLAQVAAFLKMDSATFTAALQRRIDCLQELSEGAGANLRATRRAIADLSAAEESSSGQAEQEP